jgi:hypothetical protein
MSVYSLLSSLSGIWSLWLPDGALPQLRAAARVLAALSVIFWTLSALTSLSMARAAAVATTAGLVSCWANAVRHDAERRALLHVIARLSGPGEPPTGPLRAVS